jgi:hypothetical protein
VAGSCEYSNKPSGPIKNREFLDQLNYYQLPKKTSVPWSASVDIQSVDNVNKIKEVMAWAYGQDEGDKECIQNLGSEISWRTYTWKTDAV